jgi:hypothetical protein
MLPPLAASSAHTATSSAMPAIGGNTALNTASRISEIGVRGSRGAAFATGAAASLAAGAGTADGVACMDTTLSDVRVAALMAYSFQYRSARGRPRARSITRR